MQGLEAVISNLNREIADIEGKTEAGLWEAGLKIQRGAQQRLKASVVTGNLRASAYTRTSSEFQRLNSEDLIPEQNDSRPSGQVDGVEIGFTALYALYVHENMNSRSPKYLEDTLQSNRGNIIKILQRTAKR